MALVSRASVLLTHLVTEPCTLRSSTSAHCRSVQTPNVISGGLLGVMSVIIPVLNPARYATLDKTVPASALSVCITVTTTLVSARSSCDDSLRKVMIADFSNSVPSAR